MGKVSDARDVAIPSAVRARLARAGIRGQQLRRLCAWYVEAINTADYNGDFEEFLYEVVAQYFDTLIIRGGQASKVAGL